MTMPISFTAANIARAPVMRGIYVLYQGKEIIYFGRADSSVRGMLQSHARGDHGPDTQVATHFGAEATMHHIVREQQLLSAYKLLRKRIPRCNETLHPAATAS